jgi:hypothetical protein
MSYRVVQLILLVALVSMLAVVSGCSYKINYRLSERDITTTDHQSSWSVAVATLEDRRDDSERSKKACKAKGFEDCGDYSYDKEFGGKVAADITRMLTSHLEFSGIFREVTTLSDKKSPLEAARLKSLAANGTEAVLVGRIEHFYGYYDRTTGTTLIPALLCGASTLAVGLATMEKETDRFGSVEFSTPKMNYMASSVAGSAGWMAGAYLESTSIRRIARRTRLRLALVSTADGDTVWTGVAESYQDEHTSMPGLNSEKRKNQLAVTSLREATNDLVGQLEVFEVERAAGIQTSPAAAQISED